MAWAVDQATLGTITDSAGFGVPAAAFSTNVAVAAGAWVFICVGWEHVDDISSIDDNGLGLTWTITQNTGGAGVQRAGIARALTAGGFASGQSIEVVHAGGNIGGIRVGGCSFTGGDSASFDTSVSNSGAGSSALSSGNISTAAADELLVMVATNGGPATSTPTSPSAENFEGTDAGNRVLLSMRRVATSAGTYTVEGTLGFTTNWGAHTIAMKPLVAESSQRFRWYP